MDVTALRYSGAGSLMTILLHPTTEAASRSLARTLVLEGLAASVDVLPASDHAPAQLRIEAPMERVGELNERLKSLEPVEP